jgi:hypothetical protein
MLVEDIAISRYSSCTRCRVMLFDGTYSIPAPHPDTSERRIEFNKEGPSDVASLSSFKLRLLTPIS